MNHLATAINSFMSSEESAFAAMPSIDKKIIPDLLHILNMPIKDLARLINDVPMSDWPLINSDDSPECFQELKVA